MAFWSIVGTVASKIPMVNGLARRHVPKIAGMRIVSPTHGSLIAIGKIKVQGTCIFRPAGDWVLFKEQEKWFWPQGDVVFHQTDLNWSATLWMAPENPNVVKVLLARIDRPIRYLVNYYHKVCEQVGYAPLEMDQIPEGMIIVNQVEYHKKNAGEA